MNYSVTCRSPRVNTVRDGFSLTEILVCIVIIAILLAVSVPAVTSLARGNQVSSALQLLSGLMENARQYAITKNTFVWLVIADPDASDADSRLAVALVGSRTGDDPLAWTSEPADIAAHPELELIGQVRSMSGVKLVGSGDISLPEVPAAAAGGAKELQPVQWDIPAAGRLRRFTRALQFTPSGGSRVEANGREVEFGVTPALGELQNSAIVRIAGLTGKVSVFRRR